jgi:hypothetical protein
MRGHKSLEKVERHSGMGWGHRPPSRHCQCSFNYYCDCDAPVAERRLAVCGAARAHQKY